MAALGWTQDYQLDRQRDAGLIIECVVMGNSGEDFREIQRMYDAETLRSVLVQLPYLEARTLSFLSLVFDIPKENFRAEVYRIPRMTAEDYFEFENERAKLLSC